MMAYVFIILFVVSLIYMGPRQTISNAIFLVFLFLAFRIFWALFPVLLFIYVLRYLFGPKKTRSRTYYYKYTHTQNGTDDFFKNYQRYQNNQGAYSNNYSRQNMNNYFEDKTKYYNVLNINKNASQEEIKKAFRAKAREYHPDKFSNKSESERLEAEKKFKEINEAYEKLKAN